MPDKLHIKGTITIQSKKSKTPKKKGKRSKSKSKKTSKLKPTTDFMTGNQGKIFSKEEFGQPAYTQSAVLTAMTLRQQPQQAPDFKQFGQVQQGRSLEQPKYYQLEDLIQNKQLPPTSQVLTTKEELIKRTKPLLESDLRYQLEEQQGRTQSAIQELEQERQFARASLASMEEERKQTEDTLRLNAMKRLEEQTNFFEDELRMRSMQYKKELEELSQTAQTEKNKAKIERISSLSTAALRTEVGKTYLNENPDATTDDMRRELLDRENLLYKRTEKRTGRKGRPTYEYKLEQPTTIEKQERVSVKQQESLGEAAAEEEPVYEDIPGTLSSESEQELSGYEEY